ncbi:hypothetical protein R1flu_001682 [Riccia fluitans]|uniref:DUF7733 domain-containing protein n=1 Tax=Riccia fluitans TaxID=41844 RepID=A0ABD1Y408_9MARC
MSGATLAAGPRSAKHDVGPGEGELRKRSEENSASGLGGIMGSLRVIELQLVAFIVVFSASGLVPLVDLAFPVVISLYAFALSALVFPSYGNRGTPDVFRGSRFFQLYVILGTIIGLFLPLAYVLGGFARGDQHAVRAATPHLFLLSFQVLSENIISGLSIFSLPVRALLPILYTTRRIFTLMDWTVDTFSKTHAQAHGPSTPNSPLDPHFPDYAWMWFGRALAVANTVYFSINLFCFLIPMFLPRAFDVYAEERAGYLAEHRGSHARKIEQEKKTEQGKRPPQPVPFEGQKVEKKAQ